MKNNRYYMIIILRVILITLNCLVMVWFFTETSKPATTLFFLLLLVFQTISLILFLNQVNRDLANFLIYLQENDTSLVFSRNRVEKNFKKVMTGLNDINKKIKEAHFYREQKHQYLNAVVNHLDVGLLSFNQHGTIELMNQSARTIFNISSEENVASLKLRIPEMNEILGNLEKNDQCLVRITSSGKIMDLAMKSHCLRLGDSRIKIISFQNIKAELEAKELESWKKLIRVLRHEIMNSITPVTTLTTAIRRCFTINSVRKPMHEITDSNIEDALLSADVIEERSKGLISFVEKFKSITDLPQPVVHKFSVNDMFGKARLLFRNQCIEKEIKVNIYSVDPDVELKADEHLIEQVIINLLKNSIEAIGQKGEITLSAFRDDDESVRLQVIDNGKGILPEDMENIFIPSFTTKENGMGVGLSLSRQIVLLHHGQITVKSLPGKKTVFEVRL